MMTRRPNTPVFALLAVLLVLALGTTATRTQADSGYERRQTRALERIASALEKRACK